VRCTRGDKLASGHVGKGAQVQGVRVSLARWQGEISSGDKLASGHVGEGRGKDTRTARSAAPTD
jgi:hypothetical protein